MQAAIAASLKDDEISRVCNLNFVSKIILKVGANLIRSHLERNNPVQLIYAADF